MHHIREWERGGHTQINNLVMLCTFHHHLLHRDSQWAVHIHDGIPEFTPPPWIDHNQIPRRKPPPILGA
ncbi:MAG: HNH endonuclease [Pseudonocardiaceae bacterium]